MTTEIKMRFTKQLFWLLFITCFLASCNNNSEVKSTTTSETEKVFTQGTADSLALHKASANLQDYYFEPSVSTLTGTLRVELYYGPPNFGETPETDAKEYSYILYPEKVINVIQTSDSSYFNVTTKDITKFQLAPMEQVSLKPFVDKRITVTGQFYGSHTGYHHTDVLMAVSKAEKQ